MAAKNKQQVSQNVKTDPKRRVLIADTDNHLAQLMASQLKDRGYEVRFAQTVMQAKEVLQVWRPQLMIVELTLPETSAVSLLKLTQRHQNLRPAKILVTSRREDPKQVEQLRAMGADGFVSKPYSLEQALRYLEPAKEPATPPQSPSRIGTTPETLRELKLLNLFVQQALAAPRDSVSLHNLMRMISIRTGALRVSVIQVVNPDLAVVLAANDDPLISGRQLELSRYPEIRAVVEKRSVVCIESAFDSDLLTPVREDLRKSSYESMALFPIAVNGRIAAVLSLRMPSTRAAEMEHVRGFGDICSNIISLTINSSAKF